MLKKWTRALLFLALLYSDFEAHADLSPEDMAQYFQLTKFSQSQSHIESLLLHTSGNCIAIDRFEGLNRDLSTVHFKKASLVLTPTEASLIKKIATRLRDEVQVVFREQSNRLQPQPVHVRLTGHTSHVTLKELDEMVKLKTPIFSELGMTDALRRLKSPAMGPEWETFQKDYLQRLSVGRAKVIRDQLRGASGLNYEVVFDEPDGKGNSEALHSPDEIKNLQTKSRKASDALHTENQRVVASLYISPSEGKRNVKQQGTTKDQFVNLAYTFNHDDEKNAPDPIRLKEIDEWNGRPNTAAFRISPNSTIESESASFVTENSHSLFVRNSLLEGHDTGENRYSSNYKFQPPRTFGTTSLESMVCLYTLGGVTIGQKPNTLEIFTRSGFITRAITAVTCSGTDSKKQNVILPESTFTAMISSLLHDYPDMNTLLNMGRQGVAQKRLASLHEECVELNGSPCCSERDLEIQNMTATLREMNVSYNSDVTHGMCPGSFKSLLNSN